MKIIIIMFLALNVISLSSPIRFKIGGIKFNEKIENNTNEDETLNKQHIVVNKVKKRKIIKETPSVVYANDGKDIIDKKIKLLQKAKKLLGKKYVYGARMGDKNNYDCSSFVASCYKDIGVNLPRVSRQQAAVGKPIGRENLQAGDLIFFNTLGNYISHVGMSIGGDKFVHASSKAGKIIVSDLKGYYLARASYYTRMK